jgi:hypothetical protein
MREVPLRRSGVRVIDRPSHRESCEEQDAKHAASL